MRGRAVSQGKLYACSLSLISSSSCNVHQSGQRTVHRRPTTSASCTMAGSCRMTTLFPVCVMFLPLLMIAPFLYHGSVGQMSRNLGFDRRSGLDFRTLQREDLPPISNPPALELSYICYTSRSDYDKELTVSGFHTRSL